MARPASHGIRGFTPSLTVDGQLVGITFFYVKDIEAKTPQPVSTIPPVQRTEGTTLPLSTPISSVPFPSRQP